MPISEVKNQILKRCSKCNNLKPTFEFNKYRKSKDGLWHYCKSCNSARKKADHQKHRDKHNLKSREYYALHRDRLLAVSKKWYSENWLRAKENDLKKNYGITLEKYSELLQAQNGTCAICNEAANLGIDHDHKTKNIRGLLCHSCNLMLGFSKDSPDILIRAISYLKKFICL